MIAFVENRKLRHIIRIIAITLIATFIAYDIAWAHHDNFIKAKTDTLAPQSPFKNEEMKHSLYASLIVGMIALNPIIKRNPILENIWALLNSKSKDENGRTIREFCEKSGIKYTSKEENGKIRE